jgi:hypothetical protein
MAAGIITGWSLFQKNDEEQSLLPERDLLNQNLIQPGSMEHYCVNREGTEGKRWKRVL